ncbi:hypothetical protein BGZ73_005295 [Actinomortierella ambigua]|nr:hypothetical protein BGZ73_005295 [Actinomortierella ambigua]
MATIQEQKPQLFVLNRNYSTWSLRGWLALRAAGVDFEVKMLKAGTPEVPDLGTPAWAALVTQAGPTGKVPCLHVTKPNGEKHIVFESVAILEYIAEDYPAMWPADRFERAYARSLASEMATSFGPIRDYSMNIRREYPFDPKLFTPAAEKSLRRLESIWTECRETVLAKNNAAEDDGYLFGKFSFADVMYAPVVLRIKTFALKSQFKDALAIKYIETLTSNKYVQEWIALALQETEVIPSDEVYPADSTAAAAKM